jgi:hypothetical protein
MSICAPSLKPFLAGLIDYAGLFPPANLSLKQAYTNFRSYLNGDDSWMLARFIVPAARLSDFSTELSSTSITESRLDFRCSVLGAAIKQSTRLEDLLATDLQSILTFRNTFGDQPTLDVFEVTLPIGVDQIDDLTGRLAFLLTEQKLRPFFEISAQADWRTSASQVLAAIHSFNQRNLPPGPAGLKLRCGGVEVRAFPTTDHVAEVILACRDYGVPLKATAGLHHPIRHYNRAMGTRMHGFINVFGAGILAGIHDLSFSMTQEIVEEEDAKNFRFDDDVFHWRDLAATAIEIEQIRAYGLVSYGSCSFDEPREDMTSIGWL